MVEKLAYAAGIIDGEGTLSITGKLAVSNKGTPYWSYDVEITVANTSVKLMTWLLENFDGESMPRGKRLKETYRVCYRWRVKDNAARIVFLKAITPYLVIKKQQAELLLRYLSLPRISPKERYAIFREVQALNA